MATGVLTRIIESIGQGNTGGQATPPASSTGFPKIPGVNVQPTYGWWIFIGCIGAVLLANTPVAPGVLAVMTIASLYQLENLVVGK